jgi:hypothetical protein
MDASFKNGHPKRSLKPIVIALALVLPGSTALAASMDDVVKTRADQNIDQQYGRDSVYAFSPDAKPLKPEQTGSRDTNIFGTMKTYAAEAWHKTEGFAAATWNKTTGLFTHHDGSGAVAQVEPQPYGRAGGYVGADRIAVLESNRPFQANGTPNTTVQTGEAALGNVADTRARSDGAAQSEPSMSSQDKGESLHPDVASDTGRDAATGMQSSSHPDSGQSEYKDTGKSEYSR